MTVTAVAAAAVTCVPTAAAAATPRVAAPRATTPATATQKINDTITSGTNGTDYFSYASAWAYGSGVGDLYGGDVHYALSAGGPAVLHFNGTEATLSAVQDVDQGQVSIVVDNGTATTVDLYRATRLTQATVFDTGVLSAGDHTVSVTPLGTKNAASTNTISTLDFGTVTGPVQTPTFSVDLGTTTGAFRGGAAGSLYGQYQTGSPSQNLLDGFGATTLATKAQDGQQHPGADALEVTPSFLASGGHDVFIYATDVYRGGDNGGYERTSIAQYQSYLKTEAQQVAASPYASHIVLIPFNEPDGNWGYNGMLSNRETLHAFEQEWLQDVQVIKSAWPAARIAGPNTAQYDQNSFIDFLTFAKANNVLPDVVTWHTLNDVDAVDRTVSNYRNVVEPAAGVGPLPVNLDEYATRLDLDNPASMVPWIASLEDNRVDGDLAYWRVDGTLGDSVAQQNTPNAQWWLYNWYSRMSGNDVQVTAPNGNADGTPRGLATVDATKRTAAMLFSGGTQTGAMAVNFTGLAPNLFGSTVHATVQSDTWSGNTGAAATPNRVTDVNLPVVNGKVTVPVTVAAMTAYKITLAPGGGTASPAENPWHARYEAEDATLTGSGYNINTESDDATSGGRDVGGLRTGSSTVITLHTNVPTAGNYTFRVFAGSNSHASDVNGPTNVYARVDGGSPTRINLPASYNWSVWNNVDTALQLTAGAHDISLSTVGANGEATSGDAIVDCVDLIAASTSRSYEAEQGDLGGSTIDYTARAQSGAGAVSIPRSKTLTFWVSSAADGYADLTARLQGGGSSNVTVNGAAIGTFGAAQSAWTNTTRTVWLQQGVNKVVVTDTAGTQLWDAIKVTPRASSDAVTSRNTKTYQAEQGVRTGITGISTAYSNAYGGVVTDIGPGSDNSLTLSVNAPSAGTYVGTFRFANAQELPSNHYNPDLMVRTGWISVNGGTPFAIAFGPTYSWNQFFTVGTNLTLRSGANSVKIWSQQQYNWDGKTVGTVYSGVGGLGSEMRTNQAANLDDVTVTPVVGS